MPDKDDKRQGRQKKIRTMKDAVNEVRDFSEPQDKAKRDIKKMTDAVEEIRVYGADKAHRSDDAERAPKRKRKKSGKTVKNSLLAFIGGGRRRRKSADRHVTLFGRPLTFWPVFILAFAVIMIIVMLLNSTNLTTSQQGVTLAGLPTDLENHKLLVLSDLNGRRFGDKQATLLRQIESLDFDMVICLGDMVGEGGDPDPFYELLEGLPSNKKVYFICGDSDPGPYTTTSRGENAPIKELILTDWILGAISRGAIYVDSPTAVTVGAATLWLTPASMLNVEASASVAMWKEQTAQEQSGYLAGITADTLSLPFTTYRFQLAQAQLTAINSMKDTDVHISLAHVPPGDEYLRAACTHSQAEEKYLTSPDLVLAGHYCGGVWNLPGLGAFYIPDSSRDRYGWLPSQDVVSGLRQVDDAQIYVTKGLSTCGDIPLMPFRLINSPEISVITLTATLPVNMLE